MSTNYKNIAENRAIMFISFIIGLIIGLFTMYFTLTGNTKRNIESFTPIAKEAINKETTVTTTSHNTDVNIGKVKKSDSLKIEIVQKPKTEQTALTEIKGKECISCAEDEICYKISKLNRRQKKAEGLKYK